MATVVARGIDERLKAKLRVRAAHNHRSMEAELRHILLVTLDEDADKQEEGESFGAAWLKMAEEFRAEYGGIDMELPPRSSARPVDIFHDYY